jgi:tetratricopeptide (TPR) repeat protein
MSCLLVLVLQFLFQIPNPFIQAVPAPPDTEIIQPDDLQGAGLPLSARLSRDGSEMYAAADLPEPGIYEDPARLFRLQFPAAWRVVRKTEGETVSWLVSPEAGQRPPRQIRAGLKINTVVLADVFLRQRMNAAAILKHILPGDLRDQPGMKLASEVSGARLGGLEAATCTLRGTREALDGEFIQELFVAEKDGVVFEAISFGPGEDYPDIRPALQKILLESRFGRAALPRREQSMEARQIVERYKASVVSIFASNDKKAGTGSGFIISRDGYVLTNYHVALDTATGQPMKTLKVEWDDSLKQPSVPAQLIGARYRVSPVPFQYGTDVALLKIPPGNYEPMPLSPLGDVQVGDDVVTLGFPARGLLPGISLTVTKGVVTRFNRGPGGDVQSVFVDAAFTHGSSGGPCVSLVTGGVVGLNSFGTDIQLDESRSRYNDLIKYHGVVPIDDAIREFPLATIPGLNPQATGLDFLDSLALSQFLMTSGSLRAAEEIAARGVALEPQLPLAHLRLGDCRFQQAVQAQNEKNKERAENLFSSARRAYEQGLARDPDDSGTLNSLASLESHLGRIVEAMSLGERALARDPGNWRAHLLMANLNLRQNRLDEAMAHVEKAKETTGGVIVNPHMTAAAIHNARKEYVKAREELAIAVRISPVYLPARLGIAASYENVNDLNAALAEYRRILDDFRDDAEVLGRLGLCLHRAGRAQEATGYLMNSIQRSLTAAQPPAEQVLLQAGEILSQGKQVEQNIAVFALYLYHYRSQPPAPGISLRMASIHAQRAAGGLASAHARLAAALQNSPEFVREAQRYPMAAISLNEIRALLGLQYPHPLAADLIANSPLGFRIENDGQFAQLQQMGLPDIYLQAILASARRFPPGSAPAGAGRSVIPAPATPGGRGIPPNRGAIGAPVKPSNIPRGMGGIWTSTGKSDQGTPFRSVVTFQSTGVVTSEVHIGNQPVEIRRGTYRLEQERLILMYEGAEPYSSQFRLLDNTILMDVPGVRQAQRFVRQR